MLIRFVIYGLLGWTAEIIWTGLGALTMGNWQLPGFTYLWMFPIYGLAVFFEPIHHKISSWPLIVRGLIWTAVIFVVEFCTGWTLAEFLGRCPWDYTGTTPYHLNGYIRLDYAPVWFALGLIFERVHKIVDSLTHNILHWTKKQDII